MMEANSKLSKDLNDNFLEKFLENFKELIRVSSLLKNDSKSYNQQITIIFNYFDLLILICMHTIFEYI